MTASELDTLGGLTLGDMVVVRESGTPVWVGRLVVLDRADPHLCWGVGVAGVKPVQVSLTDIGFWRHTRTILTWQKQAYSRAHVNWLSASWLTRLDPTALAAIRAEQLAGAGL